MKTSNKILLGLLVVIFAIPLILSFSLKRKIKNGEYTVVKRSNRGSGENVRSGTFTAFKVVNVVASAPGLLTCHLKESETMTYKYNPRGGDDSIAVFTSNDTLFVSNISKNNNELSIHITLHSFNNLVVDGAVVVIDSLASPGNITVTLKNKGVIKDGSEKRTEPVVNDSHEATNDDVKIASMRNVGFELFNMMIKDILIFHFV